MEKDSPVPAERTESYYNERPCLNLVGFAAELLDEYVLKHKLEEKTMKIAVASDKGMVAEHFGHCESFYIYQAERNYRPDKDQKS